MMVRLCRDTFIRRFGSIGYIVNQLTDHDRVYDSMGADFLTEIPRKAQDKSTILDRICARYAPNAKTQIAADFDDFLADLANDLYIVVGESPAALDSAEPHFHYPLPSENLPKHSTQSAMAPVEASPEPDTQTFLDQNLPTPILFELQIETTSACNEHCRHCYLPKNRVQQALKGNLIHSVIDQLAEMAGLGVCYSGGEFFLRPDAADLLRHAREKDFKISVLSNATLITDKLAAVLAEVNIDNIQVSVYSMDANTHDSITNLPGSFARTLNSVERLRYHQVPVQISCPVMKSNRDSFAAVLAWARSLGMKARTDYLMMGRYDFTTDNLKERLDGVEVQSLIRCVLEGDDNYQSLIDGPLPDRGAKLRERPVCGVGRHSLCLAASGTYYPCAGWQGWPLGDAYNQKLAQVWNGNSRIEELRSITWDRFPKCLTCVNGDYCAMCMVRNFNESDGDAFWINPHFCAVAEINRHAAEAWRRERVLIPSKEWP